MKKSEWPPVLRPRRNRRTDAIRSIVRETSLAPQHLILPMFVHEDAVDTPLESLPGVTRWSPTSLVNQAKQAAALGIRGIALFPKIDEGKKTSDGAECFNPDGLIPRVVSSIKETVPELAVVTDVALDPYSSDGHDGIVASDGTVLNDETVEVLCQQAVVQAEAGADIIAPSDMMDGRIGAIRTSLDRTGHSDVALLSYTAKYASSLYGPFRGALDSAPKSGSKATYQMDPANRREAIRELHLDLAEGADMVMVKPAGLYQDVIADVAAVSDVPVLAYQVSGEYLMMTAASEAGWIDQQSVVIESLVGLRRAGASAVFTYWADRVAQWLSI